MGGSMTVANPTETEEVSWNGSRRHQRMARAEFEALMATGLYMAGAKTADGTFEQIEEFDPEAEILLVPQLRGG